MATVGGAWAAVLPRPGGSSSCPNTSPSGPPLAKPPPQGAEGYVAEPQSDPGLLPQDELTDRAPPPPLHTHTPGGGGRGGYTEEAVNRADFAGPGLHRREDTRPCCGVRMNGSGKEEGSPGQAHPPEVLSCCSDCPRGSLLIKGKI